MSLRNRYVNCFLVSQNDIQRQVSCEQTTPVSAGSLRNLVQHRLRNTCTLESTCWYLFVGWWERQGWRMDEKIRRDSRFFSRAVTRRNTVEMDRCVHSKCHCNAGITLTEVSRSFVPPPYIFVREKDARMPPNSSSILDRILRLVANMRRVFLEIPCGNEIGHIEDFPRTWHEREVITF